MAKKLTAKSVEQAKPRRGRGAAIRNEIPDAGKPGLYLVVQPSGKKSWAVRYRRLNDGKPRKLTLDGFSSLAVAHRQAQEALDRVAEGHDPAGDKRQQRGGVADQFSAVAERYLRQHVRRNYRPLWAAEVERLLNVEILPRWGELRADTIGRRDVSELLDAMVERGSPVTANRTLAVVRRLFRWAHEKDIVRASPCDGLSRPVKERSRDRLLSDDEVRAFWRACGEVGFPFGPLGKLLLLTGQRLREVAEMTAGEIDLDQRLWTLPRERSKNDEAHAVPLSDAALEVIESLPRIRGPKGYLFTTTGQTPVSGFSRARGKIDKAMGSPPHWTFHDLRRTAASGMARLNIALPVIEKVLNHRSGSFAGIVGVYQRHDFADKKREALETWGRFVASLVDKPAANVVEIIRAAQ
jgi:integrase